MYDERSAVAGLTFVESVDAAKRLDAYTYPKQELKLKPGEGLNAVNDEKSRIGSVEHLDPINRVS